MVSVYQVELARHNMTRFLHSSISPIAVFSSSVVHPLSSLSCTIYVFRGRPCFHCPCKGSHRSTSLIISSLLRQQCPEKCILCYLIVIVIFGIFPYNQYYTYYLAIFYLRQHVAFLYILHKYVSLKKMLMSM